MNRIQILAPLVAERIAAGEVVERPGSVVKELVENALDAGATEVSVRLEDGGKELIEVVDNGFGMSPNDLEVAVLRHATSKIREVSDLERLASLGFRGEALPSIAACAELSILSREKDAGSTSTAYEWRDGKVSAATFGNFHASAHGTRMQVRSLFSQIPARLKFLKSAASEVSAIREWIERLALTHPHVGFKLETEARVIFTARPESEAARVSRILGDGNDYPVITEEVIEAGALKARFHWLQGATSPQMRKVVQIVNGRAVRDRLINQAILMPFRQALLPGQFPALAVYLEIPPSLIDVNVHPTKTELRFLNGSQIFRMIERLGDSMIQKHGAMGFAASSSTEAASMSAMHSPGLRSGSFQFLENSQAATGSDWRSAQPAFFSAPSQQLSGIMSDRSLPRDGVLPEDAAPADSTQPQGNVTESRIHPFTRDRFSGIVFQTYFLYDLGHELALVDQHAAHERIRFEKLRDRALGARADGELAASQALLIPEVVQFPPEERRSLEARLPLLEELGFQAEVFGDGQILFRGIPAEWGTANLRTRLFSLIEKVRELENGEVPESLKLDERLFEKLASEACHSAVRAGDRLTEEAAQLITEELMACTHPWNCPHGRPTIARVPRTRFEEWFQRRV